ncbi:hypothetical protein LRAMOSA04556 [Lichtheimia ramosa]|uniref:Uncharacterized protein n=1 Tax=Lichtheimia ramosa TaxID=688394 RepID=A0A077WXI9_9FUNG|nr:hypothetical protein LRAMOSA04556 [Lichtheimia ramosa]
MAAITPAKRSLVKFLKVDPETFPLLTVLSMTTFGLGYWSAQKLNWFNDDENVRVAQEPWAKDTPSNAAYKYKYYEHGNPKGKLMDAPNAMVEFDTGVSVPKSQIPKQMLA